MLTPGGKISKGMELHVLGPLGIDFMVKKTEKMGYSPFFYFVLHCLDCSFTVFNMLFVTLSGACLALWIFFALPMFSLDCYCVACVFT
jgi:hypothetical protein